MQLMVSMNETDESSVPISEMIAMEDRLLPKDLRYSLSRFRGGLQEWKGLSILIESLIQTGSCTVNESRGEIVAEYDSEVNIVLRFVEMLRKRLEWLGHDGELEAWESGRSLAGEAHLEVYARHKSNPRWQLRACVRATGSHGLPITDLATSFVLWANSNFPLIPEQLSFAISQVKNFDNLEEFEEEQERQRQNTEERRERYRKIMLAKFESSQREETMRRRIENAISSSSSLGWRDLISQRDELLSQSRISRLGTVEDAVMKSMDELLLVQNSFEETV